MGAGTRTWDGVQGSAVIVVGQKRHCFRLGPLRLGKKKTKKTLYLRSKMED